MGFLSKKNAHCLTVSRYCVANFTEVGNGNWPVSASYARIVLDGTINKSIDTDHHLTICSLKEAFWQGKRNKQVVTDILLNVIAHMNIEAHFMSFVQN